MTTGAAIVGYTAPFIPEIAEVPAGEIVEVGGGAHDIYELHHIITSEDPNDLTVSPAGVGKPGWIRPQPMSFVIDFQNEPKASAAAMNIIVKATLSPRLDPSTVEDGASSFKGEEFSFDPATRQLTWTLPAIDLPPDKKPPQGEGYVSFSASPLAKVASGTAISESAQVFFDFNPPIDTPVATRTIDTRRRW